MPKLDFDYENIKTIILPVFDNTEKKLTNCYNNCHFDAGEFTSRLTTIREQIATAKSGVTSLNNWLENSMNKIKTTSEGLESDASKISIYEVPLRESPINFK